MKRILCVLAILPLLHAGCSSPAPEPKKMESLRGDLKKRLAVVDFIDKTDYGKGRLGIAASDILESELSKSGKFTMVSHSGMDEVLNLQGLSQSGVVDPSTAVKAGKLVGANAIINGSVSEFGIKKSGFSVPGVVGTKSLLARAVIDIHVIDGTTGVIILSETAEGEAETSATKILNIGGEGTYDETLAGKALRAATASLVEKITAKMNTVPWEGFVLSHDGSEVWLTGGSDVGIQRGMQFVVSTAAKQVTSPSGKTYALPGTEKGRLTVVEVMDDISQAAMVSGQAVKDDVIRYAK
jgi:curli biogenesis system outer membrane secretion channel CsgG